MFNHHVLLARDASPLRCDAPYGLAGIAGPSLAAVDNRTVWGHARVEFHVVLDNRGASVQSLDAPSGAAWASAHQSALKGGEILVRLPEFTLA